MTETKNIPALATRMAAGEFEFSQSSENGPSWPVRMLARSAEGIEHPWWGFVVHDLAGMQTHKPRLAIDYCHDPEEILGYLDCFESTPAGLVAKGFLTPFSEEDRANEVVAKSKAGVPYEASIDFYGPMELEEVKQGESAEANGRTFFGPCTIIRKWNLRGVAVCPYGADMNTESSFTGGGEIVAAITQKKEDCMSEKLEAQTNVEDAIIEAETTEVIEEVKASETATVEEVKANESTAMKKNGNDYLAAFGERGGVYFAQGKSWEEATQLHISSLNEQIEKLTTNNAELETRLSQVDIGDLKEVEFQDESKKLTAEEQRLCSSLGENLGAYAAGLKIKK